MTTLLTTGLFICEFASSAAFFASKTRAARALQLTLSNGILQNHRQHSSAYYSSSTSLRMKKRVLVPIADDSEEIETTCITDTLTRFGAEVVVASVKPDGDLVCKMSRGVKVICIHSVCTSVVLFSQLNITTFSAIFFCIHFLRIR